jgi:methyl-accepting chemotaxis protein
MSLRKLSIRFRIVAAIAFTLALAAAIAVAGIAQKRELLAKIQALTTEQRERDAMAEAWDRGIVLNSGRWMTIAMSESDAVYRHVKPLIDKTTQDVNTAQKRFNELETSEEGKAVVARLGEVRKEWHAVRAQVQKRIEGGDYVGARELGEGPFKVVTERYLAVSRELVEHQQRRTTAQSEAARAGIERSITMIVVMLAGALVLGGVIGWRLVRQVLQPVEASIATMQRIAAGDLDGALPSADTPEFERLLDAVRTMQSNLRRIVGEVREGVESVATASREIEQGNLNLSSRTEQQASNLQQTAASMEQMTATVQNNAESARRAAELASSATDVAGKGGAVMAEVVATMGAITQSSRRISEIVGVIDGIAFQTNILALNAAVEAARAGDQGRSFAVVATEVRNLAQRSTQAAKEIKDLIGESTARVEGGARLVDDAGATMQEIVEQVRRVADLIGGITAASVEQGTGIGQVSQAVSNLDEMTQQNAALVEESAAAAATLRRQADRLASSVAVFRLPDGRMLPA